MEALLVVSGGDAATGGDGRSGEVERGLRRGSRA